MKVYVCGPMTGYVNFNREAFHRATERLRANGFVVVNPAELDEAGDGENFTHAQYLRRDLKLLLDCDLIYPLPGSNYSVGARLELSVANGTGIFELHEATEEGIAAWRTFEGDPLPESTSDHERPRVNTCGHVWGVKPA